MGRYKIKIFQSMNSVTDSTQAKEDKEIKHMIGSGENESC